MIHSICQHCQHSHLTEKKSRFYHPKPQPPSSCIRVNCQKAVELTREDILFDRITIGSFIISKEDREKANTLQNPQKFFKFLYFQNPVNFIPYKRFKAPPACPYVLEHAIKHD